ncbi:MAG: threonylcarbamoyl-AMP synthase [Candidatus Thermoplasmatota archaeon]|nr:threonylcarbamoyl-AMP synthase [Candidatus Thermoplasmatota archaeon]
MDETVLNRAVNALDHGHLIVYPTDTLYALGAKIVEKRAVLHIFSIKTRPLSLPLPVAFSDENMVSDYAFLSPLAKRLLSHFLPGKVTLVCKKKERIPSEVTAGKNTVAVRIPQDPVALKIIKKTGPLVVTSANIHGQTTPENVSEIRKLFGSEKINVFVDDGPRSGKPTTIVDVTGSNPKILREGIVSSDVILKLSDGE